MNDPKKGKMLSIFPKDRKIRISIVAAILLLILGGAIRTGEALWGGTPRDLFHKVAVPEAQSCYDLSAFTRIYRFGYKA